MLTLSAKMPNVTTREQYVCNCQIVIVNFGDITCNEMYMDWPISALYNLLKMPCNHNLKANRTKLVSYIHFVLQNCHFPTD